MHRVDTVDWSLTQMKSQLSLFRIHTIHNLKSTELIFCLK